jgi:hypothetical protein
MRLTPATLSAVSLIFLVTLGQSSNDSRRVAQDECIASLSGFPKDPSMLPKPPYPVEPKDVKLEYFASGCYGKCPAFTLAITKDVARFEGHAFVRAKGKRTSKLSQQQFETFLRAWYDGNFYAMRDNYCDVRCPDGTVTIVTDIPESSVTLITPTFTKRVYECFSTVNNQPQTPKPPEQYFELSRQLRAFAKAQHWL